MLKNRVLYLSQKSITDMIDFFKSSLFHVWRFSLGDSFLGDIRRCLLFFVVVYTL